MNRIIRIIILLTVISSFGSRSSEPLKTRDIAVNLDTPWEILWGPDNNIWMTERYGRISRLNPETGEIIPLLTISDVYEDGERGLMGMVLHPDFAGNPFLYTVYTYRFSDDLTFIRILRFRYNGTSLVEPSILMDSIKGYWNHDGSRLWIDDNLKLYATIGDAATQSLAQQPGSRNGKILRMNLDGTIPEDNPFPGSYVWSLGHRNPQGLVFANGKIYSSEHGPSSDDELNIIEKGRNYGWPDVMGFCDQEGEKQFCKEYNIAEPIYAWTPTLAVCGLDYYNKNLINEWKNSLLMVTLKASRLIAMKLNETGDSIVALNEYFDGTFGRLRDLCISPEGRVFISTSNKDGRGNPKVQDDRIIEIIPELTNIKDIQNKKKVIDIYPNPADEYLKVSFKGNFENPISLRIFNILGEQVLTKEFMAGEDNYGWNLKDMSGKRLLQGIYNVVITSHGFSYSDKLVISK
jgi:aldose sugar dehydrogenase